MRKDKVINHTEVTGRKLLTSNERTVMIGKDIYYMVRWHITISDTAICPLSGLIMRDVMKMERFSERSLGLYREGVHEHRMSNDCCYADAEVLAEALSNPKKEWWAAQDGVTIDWIRIYKVEMMDEMKGE